MKMSYKRNKDEKNISMWLALRLFLSSVKRVWEVDKKYVIFTAFVMGYGVIPTFLGAVVTAIFNQRIISGIEMSVPYYYAYYPLLIFFGVTLFDWVIFRVWRWVETTSMDRITCLLLKESAKKAAMIDYSSYDDSEFYDILQKGWTQDGRAFINSATNVFDVISYGVGLLAYFSIFAIIDWKLLVIITALRICFTPLEGKTYRLTYLWNNKLAELRRKEQYFQNFFNTKEMSMEGKLYDLYDYAKKNYREAHEEIYRETYHYQLKINGIGLIGDIMYHLPVVVGYVYLAVCVYQGTISLANMAMFISMYVGFVNQLYNTITNISNVRSYGEKSRYAREFMELPTTIYTEDDLQKIKPDFQAKGHTIEFQDVSFSYPGREQKILDHICFRSEMNELVTIIGANGAGKTTLIHLLMRLYDPTEGVILLDGVDIREYSVGSLYELFGVEFQDYCNYAVSAKESITISTGNVDEDILKFALNASTANKFISSLTKGINTVLSRSYNEEGTELSVGQRQRISLARAYYKNAPIVVLDEPSASIDPDAEAKIFEEVIKMRGKNHIFLISHRLSTCVQSDRILLIKDGRLIGNGTHNDLMNHNAEYKRMFRLQAERYEVTE